MGSPQEAERAVKRDRIRGFLQKHGLAGVVVSSRASFAWATGGRVNRIANSSPNGVAHLLLTADKTLCLADGIEAPRFRGEELAGLDIPVVEYPWFDAQARGKVVAEAVAGLTRGGRVAAEADFAGLGWAAMPADFVRLRWELTDAEIQRYREGGRLASAAMEAACRDLKPEMTEFDAAGIMTFHLHRAGLNPVVVLVASDERIRRYRHPIPVERRIQRYVMLVSCSEYGGLISNLTRFVHFGKLEAELSRRHQAVCEVDAEVNRATIPGRTLGDVFAALQTAYEREGFGDEWKLHHQGGSTGYAGRDVFATPGDPTRVLAGQAFAWNPSITGTKSEDTVLATARGPEVLTAASEAWPRVATRSGLDRPGMLVV